MTLASEVASFPMDGGVVSVAWLIPALPLFGALVLFAFGKRMGRASGPFATMMMVVSSVIAIVTFSSVAGQPSEARIFVRSLGTWMTAGSFSVEFDFRIDPLTLVLLLVVTCVGSLIHLYSVGYMRGDPGEPRFFATLNLFAFSMLVLVLANNFLVLFLGWELVGLCSYLLIGFWFDRPGVGSAAQKAFITNRVGDLAFAVALFLIFSEVGSLDYDRVFGAVGEMSSGTITAIALLLFAGAAGKSAQIPLYVWLPDAMAGPTPVSALIHAATMVTAGVYMTVRAHVFFDASTLAGDVVAGVGIATVLLAGLIAIVQDDIKKVLAYSTISQLGYMFVGVGVGAYSAGVYHLVTHAFFKALLFLGAGSVMHAIADRTDITKMGGLWKKIPWTMVTFVAGWLAIIGFPGTAGFFSKDQVLEGAYRAGDNVVWGLGLMGAVITGFYMTRLVWLTFFGKSRLDEDVHPHESPSSMVFPLVILAFAALTGGWFLATGAEGGIHAWLEPAVGAAHHEGGSFSNGQLSMIATGAGLLGALIAIVMYSGRFDWAARRERPGLAWRAARNRFGVDDAYGFIFTGVGKVFASTLAFVVDSRVIDGAVNGIGVLTTKTAGLARTAQTGRVRQYALGILGGTIIITAVLVGRNGFA